VLSGTDGFWGQLAPRGIRTFGGDQTICVGSSCLTNGLERQPQYLASEDGNMQGSTVSITPCVMSALALSNPNPFGCLERVPVWSPNHIDVRLFIKDKPHNYYPAVGRSCRQGSPMQMACLIDLSTSVQ
jgi:hypothetical protein